MYLEKLNREKLKEVMELLEYNPGYVYINIKDNHIHHILSKNELITESSILNSDKAEEYIRFMENEFGKEYIEYVLRFYNTQIDLIKKHYSLVLINESKVEDKK